MKHGLCAVLTLCLFATVSPADTTKKNAKPPTPAQLSATHGYVRVSIPQWEFAREFRLLARDKDAKRSGLSERLGTRSWAGWVHAGSYSIGGHAGAKAARPSVGPDGKPLPDITVRAGEVTDLGLLLRVPIGAYEYKLVAFEDSAVEAELAQAVSRVAPLLKSSDIIRWRFTELPRATKFVDQAQTAGLFHDFERKRQMAASLPSLKKPSTVSDFLALAKASTPPTGEEAARDDLGNLYYGADLGQLRVRDPQGNWSHRDTGTYVEVTAVDYGAGVLAAGNLRGQILISTDHGKNWSSAHSLDSREIVLDIDRAGSRWMVLAATFDDKPTPGYLGLTPPPGEPQGWILNPLVRVYSTARDDLSQLVLLREIQVNALPVIDGGVAALAAHRRGFPDLTGGFTLNGDYLVHTPSSVHRLNLANLEWSELMSPGHRTDLLRASPDGKFLTAVHLQGVRSKLSYSIDSGTTWKPHVRPPSEVYDAVLTDVRVGKVTDLYLGRFTFALDFYEFDAQEKRWKKVSEAPRDCVRLLRNESFEQRYCVTRHGAILAFNAGDWRAEFEMAAE